jgi:hypothetical protein
MRAYDPARDPMNTAAPPRARATSSERRTTLARIAAKIASRKQVFATEEMTERMLLVVREG